MQHQEDEVVGQTQPESAGRASSRVAGRDQAEESVGPQTMVTWRPPAVGDVTW